jgi:hypothetical protein
MLPRCRTAGEPFVIPTFDVQVRDVEGVMDELQEFQSVFHDCFARSEARGHFLDSMVGPYSPLARKSMEPMALAVEGAVAAACNAFAVRPCGMRSRGGGTLISAWRRSWASPMAS